MEGLPAVAHTLFIPLAARVYVSKRFPEYFYDEKALALEPALPGDTIQRKSSEYSFLAGAARSYNMDNMVRSFLAKEGRGNVVYLGAGLETAYFRLGALSARFYEVDFPQVIALRRALLGEQDNEILVSGDMLDMGWLEALDTSRPSLLVASGVFQYFTEDMVARFIKTIRARLNGAELLFDATNETGIRYANRYVQKTGNADARMRFYVNDSREFARKTGTVLLEERVFFTDARRMLAKKLKTYTRIAMRVVDLKKRAILVHLRIL